MCPLKTATRAESSVEKTYKRLLEGNKVPEIVNINQRHDVAGIQSAL